MITRYPRMVQAKRHYGECQRLLEVDNARLDIVSADCHLHSGGVFTERARCAVRDDDRLTIELTHLDGAAVLVLAGEIDAFTAPALLESVERVCELGVPVVLDMALVTFIDSSRLPGCRKSEIGRLAESPAPGLVATW